MNEIYKEGKLVLVSCMIINDKNEMLLLYRKDHKHLETAGGRVESSDVENPQKITIDELKRAAIREAHEELGDIELAPLKLFKSTEFKIPDGRNAIAHKFLTKIIKGTPKIMEPERFLRIEWISLNEFDKHLVSPDLKLLANKLKNLV